MQNIYIIGAGGYSREIYERIISAINEDRKVLNVLGLLDDNPNALDGKKIELEIVGSIREHHIDTKAAYVMGIANPAIKEKIADDFLSRGAKFISAIHPDAIVCDSAKIGMGLVAYPAAVIGPDNMIGNFVTLLGSSLGHDVHIGDYSTISGQCGVTGYVEIGKRAFLGSHASILPGKKVGDDAYVGIGSVVVRNVKAGTKVFGNPAKRVNW